MKKRLFFSLGLMAVLSGCSVEEEVDRSQSKALSFETFISKGTSTRAEAKTAFADGDDFGIIAYRHGATSWQFGTGPLPEDFNLFMNNVKAIRLDKGWDYSPLSYWEEGANHTFLAYSPYNESYTVNGPQIVNITSAAETANQIDLLYSMPETGSKNLVWTEGQKVVLTFRHALSQIRLSAFTDQDYSGYYTVVVRKVKLKGVHDTGTLNLNTSGADVSPWSAQATTDSGYTGTTSELEMQLSTTETLLNAGNNLFMQLPQEIPDGETATFEIVCDVTATEAGNVGNTVKDKAIIVKIPMITWEHNHIYHYKVQLDLQQFLGLKPVEVGDPDVVEWEAETDMQLPEPTVLSTTTLSSDHTAQTLTFDVLGPTGFPWKLTSSADWLTLSPASGDGKTTVNVSVTENTSFFDARSAIVTLTCDGQEDTTLTLTQNKAPITATSLSPTKYTRNMADANADYDFTVIAPEGRKWTIRTPADASAYKLNAYMTFVYGDNTYAGVNSSFSGTGIATFTIKVRNFDTTTSATTVGLFMLKADGENQIGTGIVLNP